VLPYPFNSPITKRSWSSKIATWFDSHCPFFITKLLVARRIWEWKYKADEERLIMRNIARQVGLPLKLFKQQWKILKHFESNPEVSFDQLETQCQKLKVPPHIRNDLLLVQHKICKALAIKLKQ
jgi:hypothetical protein